ncbi:chromate transporter [Ureibacillus sp. NPDC094379]
MIYWQIFLAFFIPGILGYGGGPATIPLIEKEVVDRYGWLTTQEFSEVLALGNSLPGPIATKMAGYIGFAEGGILGSVIALFATIAPSLILMLALMAILMRYKESPQVKNISKVVKPVIAVLIGAMTLQFFMESRHLLGSLQTIIIIIVSFLMLEKWKVHPAIVIGLALVYGGLSGLI